MTRTRRKQKGYVFRKGHKWYLRYYDYVYCVGAEAQHVQKCRTLGEATGKNRMNKKDADAEAARFLLRLNDGTLTPESTMSIRQFVENFYLPHIEQEKRVSTFKGYSHLWSRHLRENCDIALRDFRTFHGEKMLRDIARTTTLNKTSLAHIKAFLSGVFRYARRLGILREENPIRDVVLPKAPPPNETHAYSLEDILRMLVVVPEPAATAVAVAAFTGARRGEIRGMLWENFKENQISITQSVFGSHIDEPKSPKSKAPVPVIAPLAKFLERHRRTSGNPSTGLIFRTPSGTSMDLAHVAKFVIRPALAKARISWHGWHAFRRGLATNLYRLGVPDKTIQAVLRHANVSTTMNAYVKSVPADATAAMKAFEELCNQSATEATSTAWQ